MVEWEQAGYDTRFEVLLLTVTSGGIFKILWCEVVAAYFGMNFWPPECLVWTLPVQSLPPSHTMFRILGKPIVGDIGATSYSTSVDHFFRSLFFFLPITVFFPPDRCFVFPDLFYR